MEASEIPVLKVEFLMTRNCQLHCSYCKITNKSSLKYPEMGTYQVLKMVEVISKNWPGAPLIIFGGEPTVREDLPATIKHCNLLGVKHAVISNSVRVLKDEEYTRSLIEAGLSNWSTSYDGDSKELSPDKQVLLKSTNGLNALRMFRDKYGIRDLVTCITVTKHNIDSMPDIIKMLTKEGIWSICTPLQCPLPIYQYEYSSGERKDLPTQEQIDNMSPTLSLMAKSGRFLMHNESGWFDLWPENFLPQVWKCHDKSVLTVDADGMLRLCVDHPLPVRMHVLDLVIPSNAQKYMEVISRKPFCAGCFWDPAFESIQRATRKGSTQEEGRKSFRHELTDGQVSKLIPEAQKWFKKS
jgi:MoaA/NifB/PqqE/SkfB family radical SAM enzyme